MAWRNIKLLGGWCAPLDSSDFKKRDFVKYSGWPIDKTDLDAYEKEARLVVDLPDKRQSIYYNGWSDVLEKSREDFKGFLFKWSRPPTNFRDKYRSELENRSNLITSLFQKIHHTKAIILIFQTVGY